MSEKSEQFAFGGPIVWRLASDYIKDANLLPHGPAWTRLSASGKERRAKP